MIIPLNLIALVHIYLRYLFALFYKYDYNLVWLSILLLSFLIFMSNVSIINVFNSILVSGVFLKTIIIKTKRTTTTFLI